MDSPECCSVYNEEKIVKDGRGAYVNEQEDHPNKVERVFNVMEIIQHFSLKIFPNILKAKKELFICKSPPWIDKGCPILISGRNVYLVVTRTIIHKGKYFTPSTFIDDLVYKRSGVVILWTGMIKVMVINTYLNGALLFSYWYDI